MTLSIALPKGRLGEKVYGMFAAAGYDCPGIMAAGAFIQGSSIELSADGPVRPPYAVYFQGGLTWYHAKLGILLSLQELIGAGIARLPS